MTEARTSELVQLAIDGEISAAEHAELDRLLAISGEARESFDSMQALATELERLPAPPPPKRMKEEILSRIRATFASNVSPMRRRRRTLVAAGWAAAAVVVLALGLYPVLQRGQHVDGADAAGAMRPLEAWPVLATATAADVSVVVRRSGQTLVIEPEIGDAVDRPVTLTWGGGVEPARITFEPRHPDESLFTFQVPGGGPRRLQLTLSSEGRVLLETEIDFQ